MFRCKTTPCSEKMKDLAMACIISCPCIFFIRCADNYVAEVSKAAREKS